MPDLSSNPTPTDPFIPLVAVPGILSQLGIQSPSIGALRNHGYSGHFNIQKLEGRLVVAQGEVAKIAALYQPPAPVRTASAA